MKFLITAGHGAGDPGAVANGVTEADIAVELRDLVAMELLLAGHTVTTDGKKGENQALRMAIKLFGLAPVRLEIHCNASTNGQATGVESISLPKDKALAQRISRGVAQELMLKLRGDQGWIDQSKSARGKLGYVEAGGVILETFFISNPRDLAAYQASKPAVAKAIAKALTAAA
jgi:N-acetylmuramoyl-L-alanine amidase